MPTNIDAQTLSCVGRMTNMEDYYRQQAGLTKREQFAMAAMQGLLAGVHGDSDLYDTAPEWVRSIAEASVEFSDALLAELDKK